MEDDPDLAARLAPYLDAKATCKFPLDKPIPYDVITAVVTRAAQRRRGTQRRHVDNIG